ncbi:3-deoxy-D-manno-octulosonic acid transferase [Mucilaginibacter auburnensis]|uniref:3-deoxy-D-manno-octulosonic acid transferase n=1 Tax=Mucilaginibacter auburnensis TaxID=1457233 RepID=A0A2H9VT75_9SPHI|nr:glycosyltransferase N-terminal domain-containing protein [Mucilaginibacter auburnensis]PJJ84008.1 3-deoxy-D-manno-octulosonic-acid transferase [Mucilaginibacter auburnensis]
MLLIYSIGVRFYYALVYIVSFFNKKAALWISGRREQVVKPQKNSLWFHFASLGEFEQGRPVLEELKKQYPYHPVIITFFSPSGYEVRKNTPFAEAVYYLPLDTSANAQHFIERIDPLVAVFTKYEYWYYFFSELKKREVPLYIISGIFRPNQIFFKWYGALHRKILSFVTYFFVQDERSVQLLNDISVNHTTISGDTRFDRVWANAQQPKAIPYIEEFKNGQQLFIGGSTWPVDEALLAVLFRQYPEWRFIFAPHEISEDKINGLLKLFPQNTAIRYSQLIAQRVQPVAQRVLVIDNIGMLSALYQYADIAYIGGGFGVGIHNTLEAAAFGLPVIFGPEYKRFKEARDLVAEGAGFSIANEAELTGIAGKLMNNAQDLAAAAQKAQTYVQQNVGATPKIVAHIQQHLSV